MLVRRQLLDGFEPCWFGRMRECEEEAGRNRGPIGKMVRGAGWIGANQDSTGRDLRP
jgi:hypothetical protein